uniref:Protein kinase domain-containing protein n=1 Tax=Haptolina brevifila TaxID=156173 RepID=A0A7S2IEK9_9EUKA
MSDATLVRELAPFLLLLILIGCGYLFLFCARQGARWTTKPQQQPVSLPTTGVELKRQRTTGFDRFYHGRASLAELTMAIADSPGWIYRSMSGSWRLPEVIRESAEESDPPIRELVAAVKEAIEQESAAADNEETEGARCRSCQVPLVLSEVEPEIPAAMPRQPLVRSKTDVVCSQSSTDGHPQMPAVPRPPMVVRSQSSSDSLVAGGSHSSTISSSATSPTDLKLNPNLNLSPTDQPLRPPLNAEAPPPKPPRPSLAAFRGRSFTISKKGSLTHHVEGLTVASRPASLSQLRRVRKLGEGAGGRVYEVADEASGRTFAIKECRVIDEEAKRHQALRELKVSRYANVH